jgi:hypothetical protein
VEVYIPPPLPVTMSGLFFLLFNSVIWAVADVIRRAISWIPFGVGNNLANAVVDIANNIINGFSPGAPAATAWFNSIAGTTYWVARNTREATTAHSWRLNYIGYTLVVLYYNAAVQYAFNAVSGVYNYISQWVWPNINSLWNYASSIASTLNAWVGYLQARIQDNFNFLLYLVDSDYQATIRYANIVYTYAIMYTNQVRDILNVSIRDVFDRVESDISNLNMRVQAEFAALTVFMTTVFVPQALALFKAEQTAEIAAGMDPLWPLVSKATTVTAGLLATSLPAVAIRAAAVPAEPVPGVGGEAEALAAAHAFTTALGEHAVAPLWRNLHRFGEDLQSLDGVIGTVILGAFTTAAIAAPKQTADIVASVLANPLDDILIATAESLGLGTT